MVKSFSSCTLLRGMVDNMHFKHKDICGITVRKLQLCRIFQNAGADLSRKACIDCLAKGGTKEGRGNIGSKNVCLGNKCRSEKLTFVILFCVYKWHSSWESKPMIEKESGCVMHENAFVNTRQVSFLWLLKQLVAFSTLEIC